MTIHSVTFGGYTLTNCRPIVMAPVLDVTQTLLLEGGLSIQNSSCIHSKWKFTFSTDNLNDMMLIYLSTGKQTLTIDGTTFADCVLTELGEITFNHMCDEFEGSITIMQDTSS